MNSYRYFILIDDIKTGKTPLHLASTNSDGPGSAIEVLMNHQADIHAKDEVRFIFYLDSYGS